MLFKQFNKQSTWYKIDWTEKSF